MARPNNPSNGRPHGLSKDQLKALLYLQDEDNAVRFGTERRYGSKFVLALIDNEGNHWYRLNETTFILHRTMRQLARKRLIEVRGYNLYRISETGRKHL